MAVSSGPDTRQITTYLLELHGRSQELVYRAQQRSALDRFRTLVPFDGGLFAVRTLQGGEAIAHDVFLFDQPPELMDSWEQIKDEDRIAFAAAASAGTTISVSVSSAFYDGCERARAHCARFDIEHMLCTALVFAETGLYWVMSIYRSAASPPFTEDERITTELLAPHLFAASRSARLGELRSLARVGGGGHGSVAALATTAGLILEADPGLVDVVRAEWPQWRGPFLPPLAELSTGGTGTFVGKRIVLRVDAADGSLLVHARRRIAADTLTQREREIAASFSLGESHREIGDRLGIAPATVRRHLANLYEKLGVSSKAELDRMLRGAD